MIALGVSIGSGEFLLGPAAFVQHGLSLLWVVIVAVTLQTIFNTEVMRYTLATGEPVFTGFMRTRPSSTLWAWVYAALYFLQVGWPAWAGTAAAAIFFLFAKRLAVAADADAIYGIGVAAFLGCVAFSPSAGESSARSSFSTGCSWSPSSVASSCSTLLFVPGQRVARGRRPASAASTCLAGPSIRCQRAPTSFCWERSSRTQARAAW